MKHLHKIGFHYFIAGHANCIRCEGSDSALAYGVALALQLVHAHNVNCKLLQSNSWLRRRNKIKCGLIYKAAHTCVQTYPGQNLSRVPLAAQADALLHQRQLSVPQTELDRQQDLRQNVTIFRSVKRLRHTRPGGGEGVAQARKLHQMLQLFNKRSPCTYFGRVICADVAEFISAAV